MKPGGNPSAPPNWRSNRLAVAWNVPPHTCAAARGSVRQAHPMHHLGRRAAGEREQQDAIGRAARLDQMRQPRDECLGLAGARAGDDQQGSAAMGDRGIAGRR